MALVLWAQLDHNRREAMRCLGGVAVGVLNSALACAAAAQERPDFAAPSGPCVNREACGSIVHSYQYGRLAGLEDARAAVDRVRELCANGDGSACSNLARWTALGVDDIVTPDIEAARGIARRSCDLGPDCDFLKALSHPPPTEAETDDIREAVFRKSLPREQEGVGRSPIHCLAFGTVVHPAGEDPPSAFMARFADLKDVKPRSWCVEHRTGNRFSLGPVDASPRAPYPSERTVRVWRLSQYFSGNGGTSMVRVTNKAGVWVVGDSDWGESNGAPPSPRLDLAEDKRRINDVVAEFAKGWNGRDLEAMARLIPGEDPNTRSGWERRIRTMLSEGADTRIDSSAEAIEFGETGSMSATARVRLRGTWTPSPGAIVPLDPWVHEGAVTTVRLRIQKRTSWWEPGDWTIRSVDLPWEH